MLALSRFGCESRSDRQGKGSTGASVHHVGMVDIAPPRSLGRYAPDVRLRRALRTLTQGGRQTEAKKTGEKDARSRFFIGSASPDEHLKTRCFKSVEGETRQDLKIPTVSDGSLPRALSCSNLAVYRIPVRLFPFGKRGAFS